MVRKVYVDSMTVEFDLERETKGAVRYAEEGERETHKIGTLYIRKTAFEDKSYPQKLTVQVNW